MYSSHRDRPSLAEHPGGHGRRESHFPSPGKTWAQELTQLSVQYFLDLDLLLSAVLPDGQRSGEPDAFRCVSQIASKAQPSAASFL